MAMLEVTAVHHFLFSLTNSDNVETLARRDVEDLSNSTDFENEHNSENRKGPSISTDFGKQPGEITEKTINGANHEEAFISERREFGKSTTHAEPAIASQTSEGRTTNGGNHESAFRSESRESGPGPDESHTTYCLVWVLVPDARVTGSTIDTESPGQRVSKVLYRTYQACPDDSQDVEQVTVSRPELDSLVTTLQRNSLVMGNSGVDNWTSSFLERYEG